MIYRCSKCGAETRPQTEPGDDISHGLCAPCVTDTHADIDMMPTCGLVGKWGVCDLFVGHVGECRRIGGG